MKLDTSRFADKSLYLLQTFLNLREFDFDQLLDGMVKKISINLLKWLRSERVIVDKLIPTGGTFPNIDLFLNC